MRKLDWVRVCTLAFVTSVGISGLVRAQPTTPPLVSYDVPIARLEEQLRNANDKIDKLYLLVLGSLGINGLQLGGQIKRRQRGQS